MTSTKITTNADALKRAARDIADRSGNISPNGVLNCLSAAIAGPGRSWGLIKGAPSGHYVQPGLEEPAPSAKSYLLKFENRAKLPSVSPLPFSSRTQALEAFEILARNSDNFDEAYNDLSTKGSARLKHFDYPDFHIHLLEVPYASLMDSLIPLHENPFTIFDSKVFQSICDLIAQERSLLLCGRLAMSSYKVDMLEDLARYIPEGQKIATIGGRKEFSRLDRHHTHLTIGESLSSWGEEFENAMQSAFKMIPKWIVAEAIKDGESTYSLLTAATTGFNTMSTMLADGPKEAIAKLERRLCEEVDLAPEDARRLIGCGTDVIIYVSWDSLLQKDHIEAIEVRGYKDGAYDIAPIAL